MDEANFLLTISLHRELDEDGMNGLVGSRADHIIPTSMLFNQALRQEKITTQWLVNSWKKKSKRLHFSYPNHRNFGNLGKPQSQVVFPSPCAWIFPSVPPLLQQKSAGWFATSSRPAACVPISILDCPRSTMDGGRSCCHSC